MNLDSWEGCSLEPLKIKLFDQNPDMDDGRWAQCHTPFQETISSCVVRKKSSASLKRH